MQHIKRTVRSFLREVLEVALGLAARLWIAIFGTRRAVVLAYHSISESAWTHAVSSVAFRAQLAWLQSHAQIVGLDRVERFMSGSEWSSRPIVAITFDDGYHDWVTQALPLLGEFGFHATFFVTTSFASVTSIAYPDLPVLHPQEIRNLVAAGHEIGSHGKTHRDLSVCTIDEFAEEIASSCATLRALSGQPVTRISYPKGRYSAMYFPQLRTEGITLALAGHGGVGVGTERFAAPRIPVTKPISLRRFVVRIFCAAAWGRG